MHSDIHGHLHKKKKKKKEIAGHCLTLGQGTEGKEQREKEKNFQGEVGRIDESLPVCKVASLTTFMPFFLA